MNGEIRMTNRRSNGKCGQRRRRRRGFTLIEVLVSLGIIAVLMPPLLYGLSLESNVASLARNRTLATSLGREQLNELVANYPVEGLASTGGTFDPPNDAFSWTAEVAPFPSETVDNTTTFLQQLTLTVKWRQKGEEKDLVLSTLIYQNADTTGALNTGGLGSGGVGGGGVGTGGLAR